MGGDFVEVGVAAVVAGFADELAGFVEVLAGGGGEVAQGQRSPAQGQLVQGDIEKEVQWCDPLEGLRRSALRLGCLALGEPQVAKLIALERIEQRAFGLILLLQALGFAEQPLGRLRTARLMLGVRLIGSRDLTRETVAAAVSVLDGPPTVLHRRLHLAPSQLQLAEVSGLSGRWAGFLARIRSNPLKPAPKTSSRRTASRLFPIIPRS